MKNKLNLTDMKLTVLQDNLAGKIELLEPVPKQKCSNILYWALVASLALGIAVKWNGVWNFCNDTEIYINKIFNADKTEQNWNYLNEVSNLFNR